MVFDAIVYFQLYQHRKTVLKDKERAKWDQIDPSYMTSESDTEYQQKKVKETHSPAWRSAGNFQMPNFQMPIIICLWNCYS